MEKTDAAGAEPRKDDGLKGLVRFLLILFLAAVLLRSCVLAPFSIPSGSMLPRIMIGDYLLVAKWPYGYSRYSFPLGVAGFDGRLLGGAPARGDVVVFRDPGGSGNDLVKRVIGLPGDRIAIEEGEVTLNGQAVPRTRIADFLMPLSSNSPCRTVGSETGRLVAGSGRRSCAYTRYRETLPGGRSYAVLDQTQGPGDSFLGEVPSGHYLVMGDNRDDSLDGRFPIAAGGVGYLPADNLIGRALITFFSTDGSAEYLKPWTWVSATRWERIGETF